MTAGRPQYFTPEQISKIVKDLESYIAKETDPTIVGFTSSYPPIYSETAKRDVYINKNFIWDNEEFSELRKKAIEKQENFLMKWATNNELNATMSVFRLKQPQHWFTDKQEIDQRNLNIETTPQELASMSDEQLQALLK